MGIAERINVSPTLTAVFAVTTGILGAILVRFVMDAIGMKSWWQRGFAVGVAAHGIGTSRAFSVHPEAGTYASLGMGLHGVLGAVLIPLAIRSPAVVGSLSCNIHRGSSISRSLQIFRHRKSLISRCLGTVDVRFDAGLKKTECEPPSRRSWHPCRSR